MRILLLGLALLACDSEPASVDAARSSDAAAIDAVGMDAEPDAHSSEDAEADARLTPDAEPDSTSDAEPDSTPDAEPDTRLTPNAEPDSASDAEPDSAHDAEMDAAPAPDAAPDAQLVDARPDLPSPDAALTPADDHAALLAGVDLIPIGQPAPGTVVVFGERAAPLLVDAEGRALYAMARRGAGKWVHVGHERLVPGAGGAQRITLNALDWMRARSVGVHPDVGALAPLLRARGFEVREGGLEVLPQVEAFATSIYIEHSPEERAALAAFVDEGGGVISAGHAFFANPDEPIWDAPGSQTLRLVGMSLSRSEGDTADLRPSGPLGPELHACRAIALLAEGDAPEGAEATARAAIGVLPEAHPCFDPLHARLAEGASIGADRPFRRQDATPLEGLLVDFATRLALHAPPEEVRDLDADFPGRVPAEAERVDQQVEIDGTYRGLSSAYVTARPAEPVWRSTGLYAAPGEVITLDLPEAAVGQLEVQIGGHTDPLYHLAEIRRFPELIRIEPVDAPQVRIASGFGGPLYIRVPPLSELGPLQIRVRGALRMPRFSPGTDWLLERQHPAPWAELAGARVLLTLPAAPLRAIDDPGPILAFWEEMMVAAAELAGEPRARRERLSVDRQIAVSGPVHPGYPMMALEADLDTLLDLPTLQRDGHFRLFQQIGHNHQWVDWILPGTADATQTLWALYLIEERLGGSRDTAWPTITPAERRAGLEAHMAAGAPAPLWRSWTALETYLQLQEAFGWALFTQLFQEYRLIPFEQIPRLAQARIDQWVLRSSRAAGVDLGPFYETWGLSVSPAILAQTAELPEWAEDPMAEFR